jgi:hypothetical protein
VSTSMGASMPQARGRRRCHYGEDVMTLRSLSS